MQFYKITYFTWAYIKLHISYVITYNYIHYMWLHVFGIQQIVNARYMRLHTIPCRLHALHCSGGDPPPNEPPQPLLGRQYFEYEPQKCPRKPDSSGYGRVNSGTWFEAAQLRANSLAAAGGHGGKCAVAGLVWASDASFGGKHMNQHGVYGAWNPAHWICSAESTM